MPLTRSRAAVAPGEPIATDTFTVDALDDPAPAVRRDAVRALGADASTVPALSARVLVEPDASVREVLLLAIMRHDTAACVRTLIPCLRSPDAALRNEALRALQAMPVGVAAVMPELLTDSDVDVRGFAVGLLSTLYHPQVTAWALQVLREEADANVCTAAVEVLTTESGTAAYDALTALPARFPNEPFVAFAVARALAGQSRP